LELNRENGFWNFILTPDQSRILAVSGTRTKIVFVNYEFQDGGEDDETGQIKLSLVRLPFDEVNFALFLNQHKLEWHIEEACRAVAEVQYSKTEGPHWTNP
jgi:hypothetical protein